MRKLMAYSVAALAAGFGQLAFGIDTYWIGGSSGVWTEASNWSGGVPATANYFAHVTNTTPVTITVSGGAVVGAIEFSGADHRVEGTSILIRKGDPGDPRIEVAEGRTATVCGLYPSKSGDNGLYKRGKGKLETVSYIGSSGQHFSFFDIEEGIVQHYAGGDSVNVGGDMRVRSGAKFACGEYNPLQNNTIVYLEKDAVYDNYYRSDTLGGFTGEGTVYTHPTLATTMTAGPLVFSGELSGMFTIAPEAATVTGEDGGYFCIGSANALAGANIVIGGDEAYTNVLRFAPGVGNYTINSIAFNRTTAPVVLEDTNGAPVRVTAGFSGDTSAAYFTGCGDFVKTGAATCQLTGDNYAATGSLVVQDGTVKAGTATAGDDATGLAKASGLEVRSGATFTMQNHADTDWSGEGPKVFGNGAIQLAGPGSWSIGDFSVDGASFAVQGGADGKTLTLAGGESHLGSLTIAPENFSVVISGGHHVLAGALDCQKNHTYLQTGGFVECVLQAQGVNCDNDIFYAMTGGRMVSFAAADKYCIPQGVGLDLSGDAVAELKNESWYYHRLCSGGKAHTIRLRDNAYLGIDRLGFGEKDCDATATIQLDGGVLGVREWIGYIEEHTDDSPLYANILFNGGVLRGEGVGDQQWSNWLDKGHITGKVQRGGAKIDVPRASFGTGVTLTWPFVADVAEGFDGGLLKTGIGSLTLMKKCEVTGPIEVVNGQLVSMCANAGELVFGSGDVTVREAQLSLKGGVETPLCSAPGAKLSYAECASVTVKDGAAVTIGSADAAANSVFSRVGHGVLTVSVDSGDNGRLNDHSTVKVNGGLALDAKTGLPKAPIYERCRITGDGLWTEWRNRFLSVDGENRLVPVAAVAFNPASSTSATVAQVTGSPVTVSENASVGALDVEYLSSDNQGNGGLTIANGKTLTIGSGESGSVASLLINNTYQNPWSPSVGLASVLGGTISFGAAEGVILLNNNFTTAASTEISSSITGTGGLVIAAPLKTSVGHFNGYLSLSSVNPYSGGTWIEGVLVRAERAGCLGVDAIHISGTEADGGALCVNNTYDSAEFANHLELSGFGPDASFATPLRGALIVKRPLSFTGGIALAASAKIAVAGSTRATPVSAASTISGPGALVVQGPGALRLLAANTYAEGTRIESGVLEVADAGTLGTGPVEVCEGAILRFLNSAAKIVPNVITGMGTIECNGAAVTFEQAGGFAGEMTGAGSATGDEGYVKTGDGRTVFTSVATYSGDTRIDAGTLQLGLKTPAFAPAADAIAFRLDASAEGSVTTSGDRVVSWADADGRAIAFRNDAANAPVLNAFGQADKPTVYFDGAAMGCLIADAPVERLRTLVMVNRVAAGAHPRGWLCAGIFGECDRDFGLRLYNESIVQIDSMFEDGALYVNGVSDVQHVGTLDVAVAPNNEFNTLMAVASGDTAIAAATFGDYSKNWGRAYRGDIAEVIAYDRELSEIERIEVERYLASKWNVRDLPGVACTNVLPTETSVTVASGATLDLADGYQEIAALFGEGTIANGGTGCATLVLASGTSVFTGSVSGKVCLEVAEGAVLDLGGGVLTVYAVGGSGRIVNGTVTVTGEIRPGGAGAVGTLTFGSAPVVGGATLVVDGDRTSGGVDRLAVEAGKLDVSGMALSVPVRRSIPYGQSCLIVSPEGVSGRFSSTDLPGNDRWSVIYGADDVSLDRANGTLTVLK